MEKLDTHKTKIQMDYWRKRVSESSLKAKDKKLIAEFIDECYSNNLSHSRVLFYATKLWKLAQWNDKTLDQYTKQNLKEIMRKINSDENYAEWTKVGYCIAIKKFYQWLDKFEWRSNKYPERVEWLKIKTPNIDKANAKRLKDLLTDADVKLMVENANNLRDKSMIIVLYESGVRFGELIEMDINSIKFDEYGCIVDLFGKTAGQRTVRLINSVPLLHNWMSIHPNKDNPNAPLWCSLDTVSRGHRLDYHSVVEMLKFTTKKRPNGAGYLYPVEVFYRDRKTAINSG